MKMRNGRIKLKNGFEINTLPMVWLRPPKDQQREGKQIKIPADVVIRELVERLDSAIEWQEVENIADKLESFMFAPNPEKKYIACLGDEDNHSFSIVECWREQDTNALVVRDFETGQRYLNVRFLAEIQYPLGEC